jgi:hypothetical protein
LKTVPRNLGRIILGVLVAAPPGAISPDFSDFNSGAETADKASFARAELAD